MLYIYRRAASDSASELAEALNDSNIPARRTQGGLLREARILERLAAGRDRLISWGDHLVGQTGLNNQPARSKYQDALDLARAGVITVIVNPTRPPDVPQGRPNLQIAAGVHNEPGLRDLLARIQAHLAAPLPVAQEWLGRRNNHIGGQDLLNPPQAPHYWVRKESIAEEYRLHIFKGKSIRAGIKRRRDTRPDGRTPSHEWIRSFDAGWIIAYEGFKSSKVQREIAAHAVEALGLDFGAVDLAQTTDGRLVVLEVNRAPGIEGGSTQAYVKAIQGWLQEGVR